MHEYVNGLDKYYDIIALIGVFSAKEISNKLNIRVDQVWKASSFKNFIESLKNDLTDDEYDKLILLGRNTLELIKLKPQPIDPEHIKKSKINKIKK